MLDVAETSAEFDAKKAAGTEVAIVTLPTAVVDPFPKESKEIRARLDSAARHEAMAKDRRVTAAELIEELKAKVAEAKIPWKAYVEAGHLGRSYSDVQRLLSFAKQPDVLQAVEDYRKKDREAKAAKKAESQNSDTSSKGKGDNSGGSGGGKGKSNAKKNDEFWEDAFHMVMGFWNKPGTRCDFSRQGRVMMDFDRANWEKLNKKLEGDWHE